MNGIELLLYALFAAFMVYRLFSVLGREDFEPGEEKKSRLQAIRKEEEERQNTIETSYEEVEKETIPPQFEGAVLHIRKQEPSFSLTTFTKGASLAFESIVQAFCNGDTHTLKMLLDARLFETFRREIERRKAEGETHDCTIISGPAVEVEDIRLEGNQILITVQYVSEQVEIVKDKEGNVISGHPSEAENVTDRWMFSRVLGARDPNWLLVETHA